MRGLGLTSGTPLPKEVDAAEAIGASGKSFFSWFDALAKQRYCADSARDLRVDFMRGFVMFILVAVHVEIFSAFNFIVWERIGVISGAEGFVFLSGFILGVVYRKAYEKNGFNAVIHRASSRSLQLYQVNVFIVFAIVAISYTFPSLDMDMVKTFQDHASGKIYPLFPAGHDTPINELVRILLLKYCPHQIQILGLYCVLLMISPLAMYLLINGLWKVVLLVSWVLYLHNLINPTGLTGAQFEYAFSLLSWQIMFFHGMVIGYHKQDIASVQWRPWVRAVCLVALVVYLSFLAFAWSSPSDAFPKWANLGIFNEHFYNKYRWQFFDKKTLGLLRVINYAAFLVVFYCALTYLWRPLNRFLGWLFVPLGQNSLYVFIMHLPVLWLCDLVFDIYSKDPKFSAETIALNTFIHSLCLFSLWLMVKQKFLFRWVPR